MNILPNYRLDKENRTLSIEDESGFFGQHLLRTCYSLSGYDVKIVDSLDSEELELSVQES